MRGLFSYQMLGCYELKSNRRAVRGGSRDRMYPPTGGQNSGYARSFATVLLRGNEAELMTARTLNELRKFKLEP
jgi:hypothetical protein